jgi:hypothetical protein
LPTYVYDEIHTAGEAWIAARWGTNTSLFGGTGLFGHLGDGGFWFGDNGAPAVMPERSPAVRPPTAPTGRNGDDHRKTHHTGAVDKAGYRHA